MDFSNIFDQLSLGDLYKCQKLLADKVKIAQKNHRSLCKTKVITDYVEVRDDFLTPSGDEVLFNGIMAEVESLSMKAPSGKTKSKWLTSTGESYSWSSNSGHETMNEPIAIDSFPSVKRLLDKVNVDFGLDLNSCLVTLYQDGRSGLRLHADDEEGMDPNSPICVFSVGTERSIDFLSQYQAATEKPLLSLTPKEGSLYMMNAGCQTFFRHRVPSSRGVIGTRYSLSFRKKVSASTSVKLLPTTESQTYPGTQTPVSPVKAIIDKIENANDTTTTTTAKAVSTLGVDRSALRDGCMPKRKSTTVLFGTSMTLHLDRNCIAGRGRKFINVSENGARVGDISRLMDTFYQINPSANDVEKIILSFGTNDIKNENHGIQNFRQRPNSQLFSKAKQGIQKLRESVVELIKKAKHLFPGACIFVQCTLPMRNLFWYTTPNFLEYNDILKSVCHSYNCYFIDCFNRFLAYDKMDHNRNLYNGYLHLNKWGYNVLQKWLHMVTNTNSNSFNTVINVLR